MRRSRFALLVIAALGCASPARSQGVEITPFAGYRFGGDFFEMATGRPIDRDGAPAFGVMVDVPLWDGLQIEGLASHQSADFQFPTAPYGAAGHWRVNVNHFQGGGLQEFGTGKIRPFLTGTLGLTYYSDAGDDELRLALAGGGGVKLFPSRSVGVRLDGRVFATFVELSGDFGACGAAGCVVHLHTDVVWQSEFTAGLVFRLR